MRSRISQNLTFAALCGAIIAVCAQVQIPLPPVPLSLSLLAVLITGVLLGPVWGAAAVGGYVLLGAAGLPVFAGFTGGVSVLLGPTGGFLWGYILCAYAAGRLAQRFGFSRRSLYAAMLCGTLLCYIPGTLWFMAVSGCTPAAALGACVLPFLPGDAVKIALAAALCLRLEKPLRAMGALPRRS